MTYASWVKKDTKDSYSPNIYEITNKFYTCWQFSYSAMYRLNAICAWLTDKRLASVGAITHR